MSGHRSSFQESCFCILPHSIPHVYNKQTCLLDMKKDRESRGGEVGAAGQDTFQFHVSWQFLSIEEWFLLTTAIHTSIPRMILREGPESINPASFGLNTLLMEATDRIEKIIEFEPQFHSFLKMRLGAKHLASLLFTLKKMD